MRNISDADADVDMACLVSPSCQEHFRMKSITQQLGKNPA